MKPSERRALREKQEQMRSEAEQDALQKQSPAETEKSSETASHDGEEYVYRPKNVKEIKYVRKEGFFQANVRLITAIITIAVLLILIGPYNVFDIAEDISERRNTVTDREALTMQDVFNISEYGDNISWGHFNNFNYNDQSFRTAEGEFCKREYPVRGTNYVVLVGGKGFKSWPAFVYLIDYDSGELIDIRRENAEKFVDSLESAKQEQKEKE